MLKAFYSYTQEPLLPWGPYEMTGIESGLVVSKGSALPAALSLSSPYKVTVWALFDES